MSKIRTESLKHHTHDLGLEPCELSLFFDTLIGDIRFYS
jgi:hypothetical protein